MLDRAPFADDLGTRADPLKHAIDPLLDPLEDSEVGIGLLDAFRQRRAQVRGLDAHAEGRDPLAERRRQSCRESSTAPHDVSSIEPVP